MSDGDKLLEEVGYEKVIEEDTFIAYLSHNCRIEFDLENKTIDIIRKYGQAFNMFTLTLEELKAINKKVEELGWNE